MADMSMIGGIAASLRLMGDITKLAIEARDFTLMREKVIELQTVIMSAQSGALAAQADQFELLERIRELEKQVAKFEAWEAEKQKYQLTEPRSGTFAYVLKEDAGASEPKHLLCANCFQHGTKSILQQETRYPGMCSVLSCNQCRGDIYLTGSPDPEHFKGRGRR